MYLIICNRHHYSLIFLQNFPFPFHVPDINSQFFRNNSTMLAEGINTPFNQENQHPSLSHTHISKKNKINKRNYYFHKEKNNISTRSHSHESRTDLLVMEKQIIKILVSPIKISIL